MIYTNLAELPSPMLRTKFQNNRPSGSGEDDFYFCFLFIAMAAILDHLYKLSSPLTLSLALIGPPVSEQKTFEHCGR